MHPAQNPKSKIQNPKSMKVLYFIGSYGPEAMGSASHEQTILALRDRGHQVEVLTQINQPDVGRYTRVEYAGVPVYRVNLSPKSKVQSMPLSEAKGPKSSLLRLPTLRFAQGHALDFGLWTSGR